MKDELEKSNREACLSQISTYSLYQPLSSDVSAEISQYIGDKSLLHKDHILAQMVTKNFADTIYRLQTVITSPDQRLMHSEYEWRFFKPHVMASLAAAAKKATTTGVIELPKNFCDQALTATESSLGIVVKAIQKVGKQVWDRVTFKSSTPPWKTGLNY